MGGRSFGSTKSGIAPFYSDKYAKIGFQVNELFDNEKLREKVLKAFARLKKCYVRASLPQAASESG